MPEARQLTSTLRMMNTPPEGATGPVEVSVTTPDGTSKVVSKDRFTFGPPTVTSLSANSGSKGGGTPVTVTGSGFASSGTTFKFGKALAILVNCSSTTACTMLAPAVAKASTVDVTAAVDGKASAANPPGGQFAYY